MLLVLVCLIFDFFVNIYLFIRCFTQGSVEERDYISENSNAYGIVVYQAADCLPHPSSDTFGPFTNASRLLNALDKLEWVVIIYFNLF